MNDLSKKTITTLEIAEMMETEHWKVLRKLEGQEKEGKHIRGYIEVLGDNKIVVTDYFIKATYRTEQNKELPCYEVTRLGCDFLANKSTGEKGVLFTARYVKKFYEMESDTTNPLNPQIASGVAELGRVTDRIMTKQKSEPYKIAEAFKMECEQFGIKLPDDFVKVPEYTQMSLMDIMKNGN